MTLNTSQVKKIASLARIKMQDTEIEKYCVELNKIFNWIEQLAEVDTENVEPLAFIKKANNIFRADVVIAENNQEDLMKVAPKSKYGYYVVPKVVE